MAVTYCNNINFFFFVQIDHVYTYVVHTLKIRGTYVILEYLSQSLLCHMVCETNGAADTDPSLLHLPIS